MAGIRQLQVGYDALQDRLLARFSTADGAEFRVWLTRRAVAAMWPSLREALAGALVLPVPPSTETRDAVLAFRHDQAMAHAEFAPRFESGPDTAFPLGEEPLLAARVQIRQNGAGGLTVAFAPAGGRGITVSLGETLAHGFCRLLAGAAEKAQWGLPLSLHRNDASGAAAAGAVH